MKPERQAIVRKLVLTVGLVGIGVLLVAAATNKMAILRGVLQSNLDGGNYDVTNVANLQATTLYGDGSHLTGVSGGLTNGSAATINTLLVTNAAGSNFMGGSLLLSGVFTGAANWTNTATVQIGTLVVTGAFSGGVTISNTASAGQPYVTLGTNGDVKLSRDLWIGANRYIQSVGNINLVASSVGFSGPIYPDSTANGRDIGNSSQAWRNGVFSGTVTATNGFVLPQLSAIPTNSIPASSSTVTNWVLLNLTNTINGGGPMFIATNIGAAGSFLLSKPTVTQSTWP